MKKHYKIKGLPGLDGLIAHGETTGLTTPASPVFDLVEVDELLNPNAMFGDRQLRFPVPERSLYLSREHLEEIADPVLREFSSGNPYGEFQYEGRVERDGLRISYAMFERALSVTVSEGTRTLYCQNFFGPKRENAMQRVHEVMQGDLADDELILVLKELED